MPVKLPFNICIDIALHMMRVIHKNDRPFAELLVYEVEEIPHPIYHVLPMRKEIRMQS